MKKTFLLLIAVCFCFSSAYASEEFQSRKVRVEKCDSIYYYQNENLTNSFENNKPQYATIYSVGFDTVKLVFEDGTVGFINKTTFNYLIKDGKYIREEAALLEKLKKEEEKEKAAEEEAFLADLKQDGIYKGRQLWLKYPIDDTPGLAKVVISDIIHESTSSGDKLFLQLKGKEVISSNSELTLFFHDAEEILNRFYLKQPKWNKRALNSIKKGKIFIGMNKDQVLAGWGKPDTINRNAGSWGVHEQWIYGERGSYIYFENGIMTSWQD